MSGKTTLPKSVMLSLALCLLSISCFSQLNNFTLTVSKTDETCTGNGSLTFSTDGLPAGAAVTYSVFLLPDLTEPIVTLAGNSYGGLSAGTYRVVANASLGGESASEFEDIEIENAIVQLQYGLTGYPAICGDNGQIKVTVTQGIAAGYEIISGPVTVPLQTSNIFTGLAAGLYEIRVFDNCGEGIVQAHTLFSSQAGMNISIRTPLASDCETVTVGLDINDISTADIAYPLQVVCTVYPPVGPPIVLNETITSGSVAGVIYNAEIPFTEGEVLSYTIVVTDSCGNQHESSATINSSMLDPSINLVNATCIGAGIIVRNIVGLTLDDAPEGYPDSLPADYTSLITDNMVLFPSMPVGTYVFTAIGLCGEEVELIIEVEPATPIAPNVNVFEGCDPNTGSVYIGGQFTYMTLVSASPLYPHETPQDVSEFIDPVNGGFVMSGLPVGTYTFSSTDVCGDPFTKSGTISGYSQNTTVDLIEHCGSFDLQISHTSNASGGTTLWLQQLNPVTGQWMNPQTGGIYVDGTPPGATNALQLNNNAINYNLPYSGTFRVLTLFPGFEQGVAMMGSCYNVVYEFELTGLPRIEQVYSFACDSGAYDVIVEAIGMMPLTYRITSLNGNPVTIENGNLNVFSGLAQGVYNFQVEDACHNIVNRLYDITEPLAFAITGMDICTGESGQLSVPNFPFLQYQWFRQDDPEDILSTTATLDFTDFSAADAGNYQVRIWHDDPLSCLDVTLAYAVAPPEAPQAGTGVQLQLCGTPTQLNLFSLLQPPYHQNGQWTSSAPGTVLGNNWSHTDPLLGTYTFTYSISTACGTDLATATVTFLPEPQLPVVNGATGLCEGNDLILSVDQASGTQYHWQGPNGFSHTGSSIEIVGITAQMAGNYSVTAISGLCESDAVQISVDVAPGLSFVVDQRCDGNTAFLQASPQNELPDEDLYSFNWTGPGGFSDVGNPINVTGAAAGTYTLEVTGPGGCTAEIPVEVVQTVCAIQAGVSPNDDGANDNFDLSGMGIKKIKIFNRYGMTVYEKVAYVNEWKGQDYNGNLLPSATYYYLVQLNTGEAKTGWVYLMYR